MALEEPTIEILRIQRYPTNKDSNLLETWVILHWASGGCLPTEGIGRVDEKLGPVFH